MSINLFPYQDHGIHPTYSTVYKRRPLNVNQMVLTELWQKHLTIFDRHKIYLRTVLKLCNLT